MYCEVLDILHISIQIRIELSDFNHLPDFLTEALQNRIIPLIYRFNTPSSQDSTFMRPSFATAEAVEALGRRIRFLRIQRKLQQKIVAERAGISVNTISKMELGDCGVSIGNIVSVLHAIGVDDPFSSLGTDELDDGFLTDRPLPQRVRRRRVKEE